jgi:hypothetical protein
MCKGLQVGTRVDVRGPQMTAQGVKEPDLRAGRAGEREGESELCSQYNVKLLGD